MQEHLEEAWIQAGNVWTHGSSQSRPFLPNSVACSRAQWNELDITKKNPGCAYDWYCQIQVAVSQA